MSFYNLFLSLESNYSSATRGLGTKIMLYMNFFIKSHLYWNASYLTKLRSYMIISFLVSTLGLMLSSSFVKIAFFCKELHLRFLSAVSFFDEQRTTKCTVYIFIESVFQEAPNIAKIEKFYMAIYFDVLTLLCYFWLNQFSLLNLVFGPYFIWIWNFLGEL